MMGYQPQPIRGRGESKKMALREVSTRPQDSCEVKLHGKMPNHAHCNFL